MKLMQDNIQLSLVDIYETAEENMNLLFIDLHCDATMPSGAKEFGGGNTYSRGLLKHIIKTPEITCLYITRKKFSFLESTEKISPNCTLERITLGGFNPDDKDNLQDYSNQAMKEIDLLIKKYNFTSFFIHSSYWHSGLVAIELSKQYNVEFIHTIQSNGIKKKIVESKQSGLDFRIISEQKIFNEAKYLICSCNAEVEEIHKYYNIPYSKLVLTGLPIDPSYKYPNQNRFGEILLYQIGNSKQCYIPADTVIDTLPNWWIDGPFLFFGRMHIDKGIAEIIRAWINLIEKFGSITPPLWIVGGTPSQINMIREIVMGKYDISIYENKHQLLWWGTLSPTDLSILLRKARVVVTHSKYEAGGLMVLESLACSKPVIATPNGYAKDCIKDWYNGFLVEFNDIELLSYRMSHFVLQPYLCDYMSQNAKKSYDVISSKINFWQSHKDIYFNKYISQKDHKIILPSNNTDLLEYQHIPESSLLCNIVKRITKQSNVVIIDSFYSNDSYAWIIKIDNTFFRADLWLPSLLNKHSTSYSEKHIISANEKINKIIQSQHFYGFRLLHYWSIEEKISIVRINKTEQISDFKTTISLYTSVFYENRSLISNYPVIRLRDMIITLKEMIFEFSKSNRLIDGSELLNDLNTIEDLNNKMEEKDYGLISNIKNVSNIIENELYGVTEWYYSEYGFGIGLILHNFNKKLSDVLKLEITKSKHNNIILWYAFLEIKESFQSVAMYPYLKSNNTISHILSFLK